MERKNLRVVAAIIEKDGKIMIARRSHGEHAGLWEFPGGKYEENETGEEALKREIREEFNAEIDIKELLCTIEHDYPSFRLIMDCFVCELLDEKLQLHDHTAVRFIEPYEKNIQWVPADEKVIKEYQIHLNKHQ
jgi:8-oxo-dGTP diphosphatase